MGYYDDKLPPVWYTKIERFITGNWQILLIATLLVSSVLLALTSRESGDPIYGEPYDRTER